MKKPELTILTADILKNKGYVFASGRFIKTCDADMIAVIDFQKNDYGDRIYTNVGAGPIVANYSNPPKNASHCGILIRAVHLPIGGAARTLKEIEAGQEVSIERTQRAIGALAGWIDQHLLDAEMLRSGLLDPSSPLRRHGLIMKTLKKWAGLDEDA